MQDAEADRLHRLAVAVPVDDAALASCWAFVLEAVRVGWMNGSLLDQFIVAIDAGTGRGVEEFGIDVAETDPARVEVWFLQEERTCSRTDLRLALESLRGARDRARAEEPPPDERPGRWWRR